MHTHAHGEAHAHRQRTQTVLTLSAAATLAYVLLALVMGMRAHSLALVSEAGHNLTDFLALGLTWLGVYLQSKPPTARKTFGYHRAGVLAALANVLSLFVITALIVAEAIHRLRAPGPVATGPMLWGGVVGLVMNSAIALFLEGGRGDVNLRAAFAHMLGDALATALVIFAALVIARTGMVELDPLLSLVIAGLILTSGWGIFRETLNILLEGTPVGVNSQQVATDLTEVAGVRAIHDLHIWSLGSQSHALSAHVQIDDIPPSASEEIRKALCALLAERYQIRHATLQFEHIVCEGCAMAEGTGQRAQETGQ